MELEQRRSGRRRNIVAGSQSVGIGRRRGEVREEGAGGRGRGPLYRGTLTRQPTAAAEAAAVAHGARVS
jgi:hypothetical protein